MKIENESDTLRISELRDLDEDRVLELSRGIRRALRPDVRAIELDLSQVRSIDSDGADMLVAIHDGVNRMGFMPAWRVVNPVPGVRQFLELVRLHRLFEILPARNATAA
ncbi:MAG: Anti-sigma factor antagonist [Verrucomicrobia bacterium]|nr:Anti-sigma factor antagonist [Lacunisphaera sp.]MDB6170559.1 Anti-sigma factor antagonist [Verrucomicrobiota bacterium]